MLLSTVLMWVAEWRPGHGCAQPPEARGPLLLSAVMNISQVLWRLKGCCSLRGQISGYTISNHVYFYKKVTRWYCGLNCYCIFLFLVTNPLLLSLSHFTPKGEVNTMKSGCAAKKKKQEEGMVGEEIQANKKKIFILFKLLYCLWFQSRILYVHVCTFVDLGACI